MAVKSSWSAGDVLTAADLTDTFADKNNNKNLLYNGAMQVAQRGTSTASITTSGYYTADRWQLSLATLGTWTQSVEADGPTGSGFTKSLKMLCTTADASPATNDLMFAQQALEGQDVQRIAKGTASAQQLTLSFWVKSNTTGTYVVQLFDADNVRSISAVYTVNASATWEKKSITLPADTTGAFDNDNAASLVLRFWLGSGSAYTSGSLQTTWGAEVLSGLAVGQTNLAAATNNYWQVTGVQLEVGPVATGFEFKSYGQELRECQRYYQRIEATASTQAVVCNAFHGSTTESNGTITFPVTMRIGPNVTFSSETHYVATWSLGTSSTTSVNTDVSNPNGVLLRLITSGLTAGQGARHAVSAGAGRFIAFSAEL